MSKRDEVMRLITLWAQARERNDDEMAREYARRLSTLRRQIPKEKEIKK